MATRSLKLVLFVRCLSIGRRPIYAHYPALEVNGGIFPEKLVIPAFDAGDLKRTKVSIALLQVTG